MKWLLGIPVSWMLLLPYAATMNTFYGHAWQKENNDLSGTFVIILFGYYTLCVLWYIVKRSKKAINDE